MTNEYVVGDSHARSLHATVETKPTSVLSEYYDSEGRLRARNDSGGGYVRTRSYEERDHSPTDGKESVYAYVHRLCAVAWLYPDDMTTGEILTHLDGRDVHHKTGVEWANVGESPNWGVPQLEVRGHGDHSRITQAQMRAWGESAKQAAKDAVEPSRDTRECDGCGAEGDVSLATTAGLDGEYCLSCVSERAGDERIELL